MRQKCREILVLKVFRILIIAIDFCFALYHYFEEDESTALRNASIIKFASTAFCNIMDILWTYLYCCQIRQLDDLNDLDCIEVSDEICNEMHFKSEVLKRLREEENKQTDKNEKMTNNFKLIRRYFREMMEIMKENKKENENN